MRVKWSIDPTKKLHLGHCVPLRRLAKYQKEGATCIIVIGDATARISREIADANAAEYLWQFGKVLNINQCEIYRNSAWLFENVVESMRIKEGNCILSRMIDRLVKSVALQRMEEFAYDLAKGYDSVWVRSTVEVGGEDQSRSMLLGAEMQRELGMLRQEVIVTPILHGADGKKMEMDNAIPINLPADELYKSIMNLPDNRVEEYWRQLHEPASGCPWEEWEEAFRTRPANVRHILAFRLVNDLHGGFEAAEACCAWNNRDKIRTVIIPHKEVMGGTWVCRLLVLCGLAENNRAARQLIVPNGIFVDKKRVLDPADYVEMKNGVIVRVGNTSIKIKIGVV